MKTAVKRDDAMSAELERSALEALKAEEFGVYRKLREGESVEIPLAGLPGLRLAGSDVIVVEYPDGMVTPVIRNLKGLMHTVVRSLTGDAGRSLSNREAMFLRRFLRLTQEQLAGLLGVTRETVCKWENRGKLHPRDSAALRYHVLLRLHDRDASEREGLLAVGEEPGGWQVSAPSVAPDSAAGPLRIRLGPGMELLLDPAVKPRRGRRP
ncbi:MAG: hypothetical protein KF858_10285 [Candidatus Sumerlaeia bacterium]|nr:hypothetical protein [Candidatus Sumerlaeia bacterium]